MKCQNLGITTLKHATCAPNIFLKLPENQITTNFIYLTSSNFVTISHINYWDQVNSWKNLWKFWNGPLCRNKSGPFPILMGIMGGGGRLVSEFTWGIVGIYSEVSQNWNFVKITWFLHHLKALNERISEWAHFLNFAKRFRWYLNISAPKNGFF